jgi:hypothetical protein
VELSSSAELEDDDPALRITIRPFASGFVDLFGKLQARLLELLPPALFLFSPSDLLDDEGGKHRF